MLVICSNSEMKSPASCSKLNSLFMKYNAFIEATNATCMATKQVYYIKKAIHMDQVI